MSLRTWYTYRLERLILRGPAARLLVVVSLLGTVAYVGGTLAYLFPGGHFDSYRAALWWALLRLSDPGYLSDDGGIWALGTLSMALSVVGMSILVGGIVAIVTGWLNSSIAKLEQAQTPVSFEGHTVLLGWTDRTPQLLGSLTKRDKEKIVVLVPKVTPSLLSALREAVASDSERDRVILRSGAAHRATDLKRTACAQSRVVIVAANHGTLEGDLRAGPRLLKTMIALRKCMGEVGTERPRVVVELPDHKLASMVQELLPGVTTVPSDQRLARQIALTLADPRSLGIVAGFLDPHSKHHFQLEPLDGYQGQTLAQLIQEQRAGLVLGIVRALESKDPARFLVREDDVIEEGDRVLSLPGEKKELDPSSIDTTDPTDARVRRLGTDGALLVLGFNATVPDLLAELSLSSGGTGLATVFAPHSSAQLLRKTMPMQGLGKELPGKEQLQVECIEGDPTSDASLSGLELGGYRRIFIAANRAIASAEDSDVDVLAIALAIFEREKELATDAVVVTEILNDENEEILAQVPFVNTPNLAADFLLSASEESLSTLGLLEQNQHGEIFVPRVLEVKLPVGTALSKVSLSSLLRKEGMAFVSLLDEAGASEEATKSFRVLALEASTGLV